MQDLDAGSGSIAGLVPCFATQARSIICLACEGKFADHVLAISLEKTTAVVIASSFEDFWRVVYEVGEGANTRRLLSEECDEFLGLPHSLEMKWRERQSISDAKFELLREID